MRYAIYGANRVAKDFLYIFDDKIVTRIFDDENLGTFNGKEVDCISDISRYNDFDKLIVCDFDKSEKKKILGSYGLKYGTDYCYEKDFFDELNEFRVGSRKIVVWGCGKLGREFAEKNSDNISFYIDSNIKEDYFYGYKVVNPSDIVDWSDYFVVVAVADNEVIFSELKKYGLVNGDCCTSAQFLNRPSKLLEKTIFDKNCYDLNCKTMLNHMEVINGKGELICCCSTFNNMVFGTLHEGVNEAWNSVVHKILCLSNVNHTYTFCNKDMCPLLFGKRNNGGIINTDNYDKMSKYPQNVAIAFDYSCNLNCITCRDKIRGADKYERDLYNSYSEIVKKEILPHCEFLIAAGNGEVFLSPSYRKIYNSEAMRNVKWLRFLTNGLLFTKEKWEDLRKVYTGKVMMTVSIDAASKETYERVRRGGNFDILTKNMEYAAELRKKGDLSYLRFNFVVQRENVYEMIPFVKWGEELGIDEVFFTKILNWGTYTDEEFSLISMMMADGITPKKELKNVLEEPMMKSSIVDLGTIQFHHNVVREKNIINYYRWELERKVENLFKQG